MLVCVGLSHQQMYNRCKVEHENTQRWRILIYIWCFILLLSCVTAFKLKDLCVVSLRLQSPLFSLFPLHWWWWLFFLIVIIIIIIIIWFLCLQHTHLNWYHDWVWILCLHHESFSCEPWFLQGMNFMTDIFTTLCDKHWWTGALAKIPRNLLSLSQIKFLVVINLFVISPSHKPFSGTLEKRVGERGLIFRLKRMKYDVRSNLLSRKLFFFWYCQKTYKKNGERHSVVNRALLVWKQFIV